MEKLNATVIMMPERVLRSPKWGFFRTRQRQTGCLNCWRESLMLTESSGKGTMESEDPRGTGIWLEGLLVYLAPLGTSSSHAVTTNYIPRSQNCCREPVRDPRR